MTWVDNGSLIEGDVCPEGGTRWSPLTETPPFAARVATVRAQMPSRSGVVIDEQRGSSMPALVASSGTPSGDGVPTTPWVRPQAAGLGQTQRLEDDNEQELADDQAWRDALSAVTRIGRQTPSAIPPAGASELTNIEAPLGTHTPAKSLAAIDFTGPLPPNAPQWMHHAQRMIAGLKEAFERGKIDPVTEACIERAWAGWELDGSTERQIARLALLIEQTHSALRAIPPHRLDRALYDCAEVLRQGMPKHARRKVPLDDVVLVTRELQKEADPWVAVVNATAKLLSWQKISVAHAAHAVRVALQATRRDR